MEIYNEYLEFAKEIANKAGQIMLKYFNEDKKATYKADNTIVTKADNEINSYLIDKVKEKYPTHAVDGEEEKFGKSKYVWVCDPIDGTAMYARQIPVAMFSLALVVDGKPTVGVVYDPFTHNMYTAVKGNGSFKNGEIIKVNNYEFEGMKTIVAFDMWEGAGYDIYDVLKHLNKKTYSVSLGSAVCNGVKVATGDFVASIFPGTKNKNCDIAAVKVIVEEAGGRVTDLFGNEQCYDKEINGALISNAKVHDELLNLIKEYISKM